ERGEKKKKIQEIKKGAGKGKVRREQTRVAVFLAGMQKERAEAARARKEAAAAGFVDQDAAQGPEDEKEKKSLDEELAEDPFVGVALFLMDDVAGSGKTVGDVK
ncbi:MAG: tail-specific protease, partial [Desulfobulbaceae bacterium]|nr:tail-specific protease [Desulfobulbaceae bacterium]